MIITFILSSVVNLLTQIFSALPSVGVADIPYIGDFIATYLTLAVSYMNTAIGILPFLGIVWHTFIWVVLPFEMALLIAKFLFGSRLPVNSYGYN